MRLDSIPVRLERRLQAPPRWLTISMPFFAAVAALLVAAIVLVISGQDPLSTYGTMVQDAFTGSGALSATLLSATPLVLTGLAAAFAFRMKAWNIGGEGQLYIGAICAAAAGIALGTSGSAVVLPAMVVAAMIGGAAWAAIPGLLRSYLNTNEILTSLMLNYVAGLLMYYLIFDSASYWRDLSSPEGKLFPVAKQLDPAAWWPGLNLGAVIVPLGLAVGVILAVAVYVVIRKTRFGFQLRVTAESPAAARYAGMRTRGMFVMVMLISGALAGLGGASQVGFSHLLDPRGLEQSQYGYTGIVVAAVARYNPIGVIAAAVFLGAINNAGYDLHSGFSQGLIGMIEGIILFCVLGGELLVRYRVMVGGVRQSPPDPAVSQTDSAAIPADDPTVGRPV